MTSSELHSSDCSNSNDCVVEFSPGKTKYYIPQCDPSLKPHVGQKFPCLPDGIEFYEKYAVLCGFDIRRGTTKMSVDGTCIRWKYIYCNREGSKNANNGVVVDASKKRRTVSNRVECEARIVLKFVGCHGYIVDKFVERHTHTLVPESFKYFLKINNTLSFAHKKFVLDCAKANVGAMKSFRLLKEFAGSYSRIGCSKTQIKNLSRDLKAYVIGCDAQMIIDNFSKKRELCPAFFFEFEVDGEGHLKSLFWADPVARKNFCAFGDVISFDATYNTNKYKMIFAPFTGKDNHGRCVNLGAALMTGESIQSYTWVFQQFKKCMGRGPSIIMTDQDPAFNNAVQEVFPDTKHRLCMWHIMSKLPEKLPIHLKKDSVFMKKFCSVVWSVHMEPDEFEVVWNQMMVEFELVDDSWFNSLFEIRKNWIPAYFRDLPMGGLFRTTSPSESENSFFQTHINEASNLLQFLMHFDSAMDSQRHTQAKLDNEGLSCHQELKTQIPFERHAASVYTRHIFQEVQEDIVIAFYRCRLNNITNEEYRCLYEVEERGNGFFKLIYDKVETTVECSCKKFLRLGLLCCHVYFVFKDLNFETIPDKYIVSRWTKSALINTQFVVDRDVEKSCADINSNRLILHDIISEFYSCVGLVEGDHDKLQSLLQTIRAFKVVAKPNEDNVSSESAKKRLFEQFYGATVPEEVVVKPPEPVKTKGSGSRHKSRMEKIIKQSNKPLRLCRKCNTMSHHDSRNCVKKIDVI